MVGGPQLKHRSGARATRSSQSEAVYFYLNGADMNDDEPIPLPLLDHRSIWSSHRRIDDDGSLWSDDPPVGVKLRVEPARKSDIFLHAERPWEDEARLRVNTVLYDEGRFRLWYGSDKYDPDSGSYTCYAESTDGFAWERPELNLIDYDGSKKNNIISCNGEHFLQCILKDPAAPPETRYKSIGPKGRYFRDGKYDPNMTQKEVKKLLVDMDLGGVAPEDRRKKIQIHSAVRASVSPDGLRWTNLEEPLIDVGPTALDTHNLVTFDPFEGRYVLYLRGGSDERRRHVRRADSAEFAQFDNLRPCLVADPQDDISDDIYNPCYTVYPNGLRFYLMFPSLYHRVESHVDAQLAVSRDSYLWQRPERVPIIDLAHEGGEYGSLYAAPNLAAPEEGDWRLAFSGSERKHDFRARGSAPRAPDRSELRWALWKPNRLAGLDAEGEGRVVLNMRICAGAEMRLNYRTEADGWVKAELVHPPSTPPREVEAFEGFSLAEAEKLTGDEVSRVVRWNGNSDLSSLKGREVAVRLRMNKAKVFSTAL